MYWIETDIPRLLLDHREVGSLLVDCIWLLFEEFEYTDPKNLDEKIEILGYTTELVEENDLDEPLEIYISIGAVGKFEAVLYRNGDRWELHDKLTSLLMTKLYE